MDLNSTVFPGARKEVVVCVCVCVFGKPISQVIFELMLQDLNVTFFSQNLGITCWGHKCKA